MLPLQPENSNVDLSVDQAVVGETFTVSANDFSATAPGAYLLTISGVGGAFENEISFPINILDANPVPGNPILPENNATGIGTTANLEWDANATIGMTYQVEIATDEGFANIFDASPQLTENTYTVNGLSSQTTYYWRVTNTNTCGASSPSSTFQFTTFVCVDEPSSDVPVSIPNSDPDIVSSELEVAQAGEIADIDVVGIEGNHSFLSDLKFKLIAPDGTSVELARLLCGLNITLQSNGNVIVNNPENIAGTYASSGEASFGPDVPFQGITAPAVLLDDGFGDPNDGCEGVLNEESIEGNIALINDGGCSDVDKVLLAQEFGALAVIVINPEEDGEFFPLQGSSNEVEIPSIMISNADGDSLISALETSSANFSFSFDDDALSNNPPCPATDGGAYTPYESLDVFNGQDAQGTWTLEVEDVLFQNGGSLNNWSLSICYADGELSTSSQELISQIGLFPNPTTGELTVDLGELRAERVLLIDISGRVIESQISNNQLLNFDLSPYSNGLYFIKVEGSDFESVHKVIKND